jgi:Nuclease-related domain
MYWPDSASGFTLAATLAHRKLIRFKRDDVCSICSRALPAGMEGYWQTPERRAICRPCGDLPAAAVSAPGANADREYARRRQARIERQRKRWGRVGSWAAELSDGPQHEQAWARGAAGERRNATRLEKLVEGQPVSFLHDRRIPGSRANIDHIAIGPSGVFVVDSKNAKGQVKVDWKGLFSNRRWYLYVGGRDKTEWVEGVENQVELVRTALAGAGHAGVPVYGALCMANGEGLPWIGHPRLREIPICRPRHVAKRLLARGPLTADAIRVVHLDLERAFPAA